MAHLKDDSLMPYGAHKGTAMANVPANYLLWLFENNKCTPPVEKYVKDNLDIIKTQIDNCR